MNSMKSSVNAEAFADALKKISVVLKKAVIPQIGQVRTAFTEGVCTLTATDMNIWMTTAVPAAGDAFSFVFQNTKSIAGALLHCTGELTLELFQSGGQPMLSMVCGDRSAEVKVWDAEIYPVHPAVDARQTYTTRADVLLKRVNRVKYAARFQMSRPELGGVRFEDNHVWCVDGNRMAVNDSPDLTVSERFIVPVDALKHLKAFGRSNLEIQVGERYAAFSGGGLTLCCRLLDASDRLRVETALPQKPVETYRVERRQYTDAIRYLSDCAGGMKKRSIHFRRGTLLLVGEDAKFSAKVGVFGSCEMEYAFDLGYMKDALEQFAGAEMIQMSSGGVSPIVLNAGADTAMVMPQRPRDSLRAA